MSALAILLVELRRVGSMAVAERLGNRVFVLGNSDNVDVVDHQAVGGDAESMTSRIVIEQFAIEGVVRIDEKDIEAADASLGNVMRETRTNNPSQPNGPGVRSALRLA